ncbi:MAG: nucleotide exchange factor GrpE [Desulfobacterales bacterium]|nr:MAG: nucleotide exchange factor GrpE [Desulfobacterales bacterium]
MVLKENKAKKEETKKNTADADSAASAAEANAADAQGPPEADLKEGDAVIQELQDQVAAEKDKALRLSAEFENFKKRKQREIDDFKKFANEMVFKQLLSVVDNLERAIASASAAEASDDAGLLDGVKLTHKDLMKLFESFNVRPVEAENHPFDPNFHQAVTQEENNDLPDNTVTTVLQKGYTLHDRLIRPTMVVVSKRVEKEPEETKEK